MEYALLLGLFAILGGALWYAGRAKKAEGKAEAELTEAQKDIEGLANAMEDIQDAQRNRPKSVADAFKRL